MKITVVVDNIGKNGLPGEWGFCAYVEYADLKLLVDAGASSLFAQNAHKLGLDLSAVDYAFLSHAHYDHGNGMETFFSENAKASFYLQSGCRENCYAKKFFFRKYIGIPKGIIAGYPDRLMFVSGLYKVSDGISILSHSTPGLEQIGKREHMYLKTSDGWIPDDFRHEQSLIIESDEGLVIFNSCSHGGAANIIHEVQNAFPGKKIKSLIGGFHLFTRSDAEVRELARLIRATGIEEIYTGHCTGEKGFQILKEELGDMAHQFHVGLQIEY